jgi:hypothetical protein
MECLHVPLQVNVALVHEVHTPRDLKITVRVPNAPPRKPSSKSARAPRQGVRRFLFPETDLQATSRNEEQVPMEE